MASDLLQHLIDDIILDDLLDDLLSSPYHLRACLHLLAPYFTLPAKLLYKPDLIFSGYDFLFSHVLGGLHSRNQFFSSKWRYYDRRHKLTPLRRLKVGYTKFLMPHLLVEENDDIHKIDWNVPGPICAGMWYWYVRSYFMYSSTNSHLRLHLWLWQLSPRPARCTSISPLRKNLVPSYHFN